MALTGPFLTRELAEAACGRSASSSSSSSHPACTGVAVYNDGSKNWYMPWAFNVYESYLGDATGECVTYCFCCGPYDSTDTPFRVEYDPVNNWWSGQPTCPFNYRFHLRWTGTIFE